ncbi:MAG: photosystem II protein Psb27 [Cyanobacteria bacterium P01_H01_bin.15]
MFFKTWLGRFLSLALVAVITLSGCTTNPSGLTGNYTQDTLTVIETLRSAINSDKTDEGDTELKTLARSQINDYVSRYRRDDKKGGSRSFTTMQTALNALAGYYSSYGNRPLPEKLKTRLDKEFRQVEISLKRGL